MFPKDRDKVPPLSVVSRLTYDQRLHLLAGLLNSADLFSAASRRLKSSYFSEAAEAPLRLLWQAAVSLAERIGVERMFASRERLWNMLHLEVDAAFKTGASRVPEAFHAELLRLEPPGILARLFGGEPDGFDHRYVVDLLNRFLRERGLHDVMRSLTDVGDQAVITNFGELAVRAADLEADLAVVDVDPVESAAPDGWMPSPSGRRPTGISWLDAFLRGGHAPGEVLGVLGVYGSGKTTLGLQLLSSVAELEQMWAVDPESREESRIEVAGEWSMGHVYYFFYEMPIDEIRKKLWSLSAHIDLDRIDRLGNKNFKLSDTPQLDPAQKELIRLVRKQTKGLVGDNDFLSERDRLERAKKVLNVNIHLVDGTGNGSHAHFGRGGVSEIARVLEGERRKGRRIALVVIDYAGACVDRMCDDQDQVYLELSRFGRKAEHEIGVPFQTPVWVLHQLSGAANERTAATRQHHSQAAGSKRFAENLWFCFNIGAPDSRYGCRYFTCSKARRGVLGTPPILRIADGFNRLVDVSHRYQFDNSGRVRDRTAGGPAAMAGGKMIHGDEDEPGFSVNSAAPPPGDPFGGQT